MKRKLVQSMPLFSTLGAIVLLGLIAFSLTPADAVMEEPTEALPTSATAPTNETDDAVAVVPTENNTTGFTEAQNYPGIASLSEPTYNPTMLVVAGVGLVLLTISAITLIYKHKR